MGGREKRMGMGMRKRVTREVKDKGAVKLKS